MSANRADVKEIRKARSSGSEVGQALWEELLQLRGEVMRMQSEVARLGNIRRIVVSTNNGETGTERTYSVPLAVAKASVMAISCGSGAIPASVTSAKCNGGAVTVAFDVDPSTDHKVSLWVAAPDKYLA